LAPHRCLHSFPTRRSSDLAAERIFEVGVSSTQRARRKRLNMRYSNHSASNELAPVTAACAPLETRKMPYRSIMRTAGEDPRQLLDRKSTRLNSSHVKSSYA